MTRKINLNWDSEIDGPSVEFAPISFGTVFLRNVCREVAIHRERAIGRWGQKYLRAMTCSYLEKCNILTTGYIIKVTEGSFAIILSTLDDWIASCAKSGIDLNSRRGAIRQTLIYINAFGDACGREPNYSDSWGRVKHARGLLNYTEFEGWLER